MRGLTWGAKTCWTNCLFEFDRSCTCVATSTNQRACHGRAAWHLLMPLHAPATTSRRSRPWCSPFERMCHGSRRFGSRGTRHRMPRVKWREGGGGDTQTRWGEGWGRGAHKQSHRRKVGHPQDALIRGRGTAPARILSTHLSFASSCSCSRVRLVLPLPTTVLPTSTLCAKGAFWEAYGCSE